MDIETISAESLAAKWKAGVPIELVDVRTGPEFHELHVEFARNVPIDRLDPQALPPAKDRPASEKLYIVCRSGTRGKEACRRLARSGLVNVVNVDGGTLACQQAGLPMTYGRRAVSLERQVRIAAGSLVLLGAVLGWLVHPALFGIAAFIGAGLIFAGITDTCGMGVLLARMPWNRGTACPK